jgi:transposase
MPPGSPFGPNLVALILHLHVTQAIGFERLVRLLDEVFGIRVSEGAPGLCRGRLLPTSSPAPGHH